MKRWERIWFNLLAAVVAVTGILYFWMEYMMSTDDPFAVVNHPWQPWTLSLHVLAAPALLVLFGIVVSSHVAYKLRNGRQNRRSGVAALGLFLVMAASGYLLQVVTGERSRQVWLVVHLASGALFMVIYALHLLTSAVLWRRAQRADGQRNAA